MDIKKIKKRATKEKRKGKGLSVYIEEGLLKKFDEKCKKIGSDKSKVIRALIQEFMGA